MYFALVLSLVFGPLSAVFPSVYHHFDIYRQFMSLYYSMRSFVLSYFCPALLVLADTNRHIREKRSSDIVYTSFRVDFDSVFPSGMVRGLFGNASGTLRFVVYRVYSGGFDC